MTEEEFSQESVALKKKLGANRIIILAVLPSGTPRIAISGAQPMECLWIVEMFKKDLLAETLNITTHSDREIN